MPDPTPADQIRAALLEAQVCRWLRCPGYERRVAGALVALDALEAEHADRVWLTRDEAEMLRRWIVHGVGTATVRQAAWVALLDERMGA